MVTMTLIETKTVGAGGSPSIEFTNIPQTFTDVVLLVNVKCDQSLGDFYAQLNGDAGSNYLWRRAVGSGTSTTSDTTTQTGFYFGSINGTGQTANTFSSVGITIPNYSVTGSKVISAETTSENNASNAYQTVAAGRWSGTAAVTSIKLLTIPGNLAQYSTASLYGVSNALDTVSGTAKATGGTITKSGGYVYHTFTASGTFTPTQSLNVETIVVAGGGGGARAGGGGGAGGLIASTLSLSATGYPVTIGAGGAGMVAGQSSASTSNGNNSVFSTLTAIAGGGGGGYNANGLPVNGASGGSGGGSWGGQTPNYAAGTAGQGNNGGAGGNYTAAYGEASGGGGGAGAAGATGIGGVLPIGGIGSNLAIWAAATSTGDNGYYAGGGGGYGSQAAPNNHGGGAGGLGGGGKGGYSSAAFINGTAGIANTGGGGGGASYINNLTTVGVAGQGGSGIVIVRYQG